MSMIEIMEELPKLTHQERRQLCQRILSLEAEQEELAFCDESARQGFALLDALEAEDQAHARRPQG